MSIGYWIELSILNAARKGTSVSSPFKKHTGTGPASVWNYSPSTTGQPENSTPEPKARKRNRSTTMTPPTASVANQRQLFSCVVAQSIDWLLRTVGLPGFSPSSPGQFWNFD